MTSSTNRVDEEQRTSVRVDMHCHSTQVIEQFESILVVSSDESGQSTCRKRAGGALWPGGTCSAVFATGADGECENDG